MLVDMHAHVIPKDYPDLDERVAALVRGEAAFFNPSRRLDAMEASGVDAEVVSPLPPLLAYELPAERALELARQANDSIAQLCAAAPDRLMGLGTVPLQDPDLAAEELSRIGGAGLCGIEIGSNVGGTSLGNERFLSFFQEVERLGLPVFVHALNPTLAGRLPGRAIPGFGFATEISVAAASVVSEGLAEKCPGLRMAFSHGAGGFPLMLTREQYFWGGGWNEETRPEGGLLADRSRPAPSESARRFWYDTLVFDRRALRYLIDMIGHTQLLIGTDFPAMPRERPAGATLRSMGLDASVLDDILWNNCFRFLGIEPPAAGHA
jgi:aminocarboxymuconate-semialdehyde decarboxylase